MPCLPPVDRPGAPPRPRAPRIALAAALAAGAGAALLAGCASLDTQPKGGGAAIAGRWQIDGAHSDDFDARLDQWLEAHRKKMRELRRRGYGEPGDPGAESGEGQGGGRGGDSRGPPALFMAPEDPLRERNRAAEELRPPAGLEIVVAGDVIRIAVDSEPARQFVPGEKVTRIDSGGAAELQSGWEGDAFIVRARYLHKAQREWRYERERATGLLKVDFLDTDPDYGRFELHLRYRPTGGT